MKLGRRYYFDGGNAYIQDPEEFVIFSYKIK